MDKPKYHPKTWVIATYGTGKVMAKIAGASFQTGEWLYDLIKPGTDFNHKAKEDAILLVQLDSGKGWKDPNAPASQSIRM